jgi:plasmid stability protein
MKSIHIRNVDPDVLLKIERLAKMHHRSVQGELRVLLSEAARRVPAKDVFDAKPPVTVSLPQNTTWRREEIYSNEARKGCDDR